LNRRKRCLFSSSVQPTASELEEGVEVEVEVEVEAEVEVEVESDEADAVGR
jgi:hypothetical protein